MRNRPFTKIVAAVLVCTFAFSNVAAYPIPVAPSNIYMPENPSLARQGAAAPFFPQFLNLQRSEARFTQEKTVPISVKLFSGDVHPDRVEGFSVTMMGTENVELKSGKHVFASLFINAPGKRIMHETLMKEFVKRRADNSFKTPQNQTIIGVELGTRVFIGDGVHEHEYAILKVTKITESKERAQQNIEFEITPPTTFRSEARASVSKSVKQSKPIDYGKALRGIQNETLRNWALSQARFFNPKNIVIVNARNVRELKKEAVRLGFAYETNDGHFVAFSHPDDVKRVVERTFVASKNPNDKGAFNNYKDSDEVRAKLDPLMENSMEGDTMYVIPYLMGLEGYDLTRAGIQLTNSLIPLLNMATLNSVGKAAWEKMEEPSGLLLKGVHSTGDLNEITDILTQGKEDNRYYVSIVDEGFVVSYLSNYGGNVIQSKKHGALRMAGYMGRKEGWLAEHMLLLGIQDLVTGETKYIAGAYPSQTGKTNTALMRLQAALGPRYKLWFIGDDISWMKIGTDGRLRAMNPESGAFAVIYGTSWSTNPVLMEAIQNSHGGVYTNVAFNKITHEVFWEGKLGFNSNGKPIYPSNLRGWIDWRREPIANRPLERQRSGSKEDLWANDNSRLALPLNAFRNWIGHAKNLKPEDRPTDWNNPEGVPIDLILWGGRMANDEPILRVFRNVLEGVTEGFFLMGETTAATAGKTGVLKFDSFANEPFEPGKVGDHAAHMLQVMQELERHGKAPIFARINPFRKINGRFAYRGYDANFHLIMAALFGKAWNKTPIGLIPKSPESVHLQPGDLLIPNSWDTLTEFNPNRWADIIIPERDAYIKKLYEKGDYVPDAIMKQYQSTRQEILSARSETRSQNGKINDHTWDMAAFRSALSRLEILIDLARARDLHVTLADFNQNLPAERILTSKQFHEIVNLFNARPNETFRLIPVTTEIPDNYRVDLRSEARTPVKILLADAPEEADKLENWANANHVSILPERAFGKDEAKLSEVIQRENPDVVFVRSTTKLNAELLKLLKGKTVVRGGSDTDNIDLAAAEKENVLVIRTGGAENSVANLFLRFMVRYLSRLNPRLFIRNSSDFSSMYQWQKIFDIPNSQFVKAAQDSKRGVMTETQINSLFAKTIPVSNLKFVEFLENQRFGFIGFGNIPQVIIQKLNIISTNLKRRPFKMMATSRSLRHPLQNGGGEARKTADNLNVPSGTINKILREANIISLHLPGKAGQILDREKIEILAKRRNEGPILLINTSRVSLVDHEALRQALARNHNLYYIADLDFSDELTMLQRDFPTQVLLTPHIGASTEDGGNGVENNTITVFDQLLRVHLSNDPLASRSEARASKEIKTVLYISGSERAREFFKLTAFSPTNELTGIKPLVARNIKTARKILKSSSVDAIITDSYLTPGDAASFYRLTPWKQKYKSANGVLTMLRQIKVLNIPVVIIKERADFLRNQMPSNSNIEIFSSGSLNQAVNMLAAMNEPERSEARSSVMHINDLPVQIGIVSHAKNKIEMFISYLSGMEGNKRYYMPPFPSFERIFTISEPFVLASFVQSVHDELVPEKVEGDVVHIEDLREAIDTVIDRIGGRPTAIHSATYTIGKTFIQISKSPLARTEADAVVVGMNTSMFAGGGTAEVVLNAIKLAKGFKSPTSAVALVTAQKLAFPQDAGAEAGTPESASNVGKAVISGSLKEQGIEPAGHWNYVISALIHDLNSNAGQKNIADATFSALKLADEHKLKSVVFPAIGTGALQVTIAQSAEGMLRAVQKFAAQNPNTSIRVIKFALINQEKFHEFAGVASRILSQRSEARNVQNPVAIVGKIGGTSIAFEATDDQKLLGGRVKAVTNQIVNPDQTVTKITTSAELVNHVVNQLSQLIDRYGADRISKIYFTSPGYFNPDGSLAEDEANIPALKKGFNFAEEVGRVLNQKYPRNPKLGPIQVEVVHDGTGGALGEVSVHGTHPGAKDLFYVIAGTGIGTRRLINGKPFLGDERVNYFHNEGPHALVFNGDPYNPDYQYVAIETKGLHPDFTTPGSPYYGKEDLEDRTNGPALARYAREQIAFLDNYPNPNFDAGVRDLLKRSEDNLNKLDAKIIGEAANDGNNFATKIVRDRALELGIGLTVLIIESNRLFPEFNLPEHIVIGSGVAQIGPLFLDAVKVGVQKRIEKYKREEKLPANFDVKEFVSRFELSKIKDDTARELFGGMPAKEDLDVYQQKLNSSRSEARFNKTKQIDINESAQVSLTKSRAEARNDADSDKAKKQVPAFLPALTSYAKRMLAQKGRDSDEIQLPAHLDAKLRDIAASVDNPSKLVSIIMRDEELTKGLIDTGVWGEKTELRETLNNIAFGQPNDDTIRAVRQLTATVRASMKNTPVSHVVANILMDRRLRAKEFMAVTDELLRTQDAMLAENLENLLKNNPDIQSRAFQWLFDRMIREAELSASDVEHKEEHLLTVSIILKQINRILSADNAQWLGLQVHMLMRFAERVASESKQTEKPFMTALLMFYPTISRDFFLAVNTIFAKVSKTLSDQKVVEILKKYGGYENYAQAIETLLSFAVIAWQDEFYDYLLSHFPHADSMMQAQYLNSMKYGIHMRGKEEITVNDERLKFILENVVKLSNEKYPFTRSRLTETMEFIADEMVDHLLANGLYMKLSQSRRTFLIEFLLKVSIFGEIQGGREKVRPMVMFELAQEDNLEIISKILFGDYFSDEFLKTLSPEDGKVLRTVILKYYQELGSTDLLQKNLIRIMQRFGVKSIVEAFEFYGQHVTTNSEKALASLSLAAHVASVYDAKDSQEDRKVFQDIFLKVITLTKKITLEKLEDIEDYYELRNRVSGYYKDLEGLIDQTRGLTQTAEALNAKVREFDEKKRRLRKQQIELEAEEKNHVIKQSSANLIIKELSAQLVKRPKMERFTSLIPFPSSKAESDENSAIYIRMQLKEARQTAREATKAIATAKIDLRAIQKELEQIEPQRQKALEEQMKMAEAYNEVKAKNEKLEKEIRNIEKNAMAAHKVLVDSSKEKSTQYHAILRLFLESPSLTPEMAVQADQALILQKKTETQPETFLDGETLLTRLGLALNARFQKTLSPNQIETDFAKHLQYQAAHGLFQDEVYEAVTLLAQYVKNKSLLPKSPSDPIYQALQGELKNKRYQRDALEQVSAITSALEQERARHKAFVKKLVEEVLRITGVADVSLLDSIGDFLEEKLGDGKIAKERIEVLQIMLILMAMNSGVEEAIESFFYLLSGQGGLFFLEPAKDPNTIKNPRARAIEIRYKKYFDALRVIQDRVYHDRQRIYRLEEGFGWNRKANNASLDYFSAVFNADEVSEDLRRDAETTLGFLAHLPWTNEVEEQEKDDDTWYQEFIALHGKKPNKPQKLELDAFAILSSIENYLLHAIPITAEKIKKSNGSLRIGKHSAKIVIELSYVFSKKVIFSIDRFRPENLKGTLSILEKMASVLDPAIAYKDGDKNVQVLGVVREAMSKVKDRLSIEEAKINVEGKGLPHRTEFALPKPKKPEHKKLSNKDLDIDEEGNSSRSEARFSKTKQTNINESAQVSSTKSRAEARASRIQDFEPLTFKLNNKDSVDLGHDDSGLEWTEIPLDLKHEQTVQNLSHLLEIIGFAPKTLSFPTDKTPRLLVVATENRTKIIFPAIVFFHFSTQQYKIIDFTGQPHLYSGYFSKVVDKAITFADLKYLKNVGYHFNSKEVTFTILPSRSEARTQSDSDYAAKFSVYPPTIEKPWALTGREIGGVTSDVTDEVVQWLAEKIAKTLKERPLLNDERVAYLVRSSRLDKHGLVVAGKNQIKDDERALKGMLDPLFDYLEGLREVIQLKKEGKANPSPLKNYLSNRYTLIDAGIRVLTYNRQLLRFIHLKPRQYPTRIFVIRIEPARSEARNHSEDKIDNNKSAQVSLTKSRAEARSEKSYRVGLALVRALNDEVEQIISSTSQSKYRVNVFFDGNRNVRTYAQVQDKKIVQFGRVFDEKTFTPEKKGKTFGGYVLNVLRTASTFKSNLRYEIVRDGTSLFVISVNGTPRSEARAGEFDVQLKAMGKIPFVKEDQKSRDRAREEAAKLRKFSTEKLIQVTINDKKAKLNPMPKPDDILLLTESVTVNSVHFPRVLKFRGVQNVKGQQIVRLRSVYQGNELFLMPLPKFITAIQQKYVMLLKSPQEKAGKIAEDDFELAPEAPAPVAKKIVAPKSVQSSSALSGIKPPDEDDSFMNLVLNPNAPAKPKPEKVAESSEIQQSESLGPKLPQIVIAAAQGNRVDPEYLVWRWNEVRSKIKRKTEPITVEQVTQYLKSEGFTPQQEEAKTGTGKKQAVEIKTIWVKAGRSEARSGLHLLAPLRTILIVDNDLEHRKAELEILGGLVDSRIRLLEASNGEEALREITTVTQSGLLLITDLEMPKVSGDELIKQVAPEVPVILISSRPADEPRISTSRLIHPNFTFLQKPFPVQALRQTIVSLQIRSEVRNEVKKPEQSIPGVIPEAHEKTFAEEKLYREIPSARVDDRPELIQAFNDLDSSEGLSPESRSELRLIASRMLKEPSHVTEETLAKFDALKGEKSGNAVSNAAAVNQVDLNEATIIMPDFTAKLFPAFRDITDVVSKRGRALVAANGKEQVNVIRDFIRLLPKVQQERVQVINFAALEQIEAYLIQNQIKRADILGLHIENGSDEGRAEELKKTMPDVVFAPKIFSDPQDVLGIFGLEKQIVLEQSERFAAEVAA